MLDGDGVVVVVVVMVVVVVEKFVDVLIPVINMLLGVSLINIFALKLAHCSCSISQNRYRHYFRSFHLFSFYILCIYLREIYRYRY